MVVILIIVTDFRMRVKMRLTINSSIKSCEYEDEAEGAGRMTTDMGGRERRWRGGVAVQ